MLIEKSVSSLLFLVLAWPIWLCHVATASEAETSVRGVVRAKAKAKISSELVAKITRLPYRVGQAFKKGDPLVEFDCRRYRAELRGSEAEARGFLVTVKQNRALVKRRAAGANDLAIAVANYEKARATVDALKIRIGQCVIAAPFDGRVAERLVDVHELPQANKPLLSIVQDGQLEVDLIAPSDWLNWLEIGHTFAFQIDETQSRHDAEIVRLAATVDPISRTVSLSAKLLAPGAKVRPGMSGTAQFQR